MRSARPRRLVWIDFQAPDLVTGVQIPTRASRSGEDSQDPDRSLSAPRRNLKLSHRAFILVEKFDEASLRQRLSPLQYEVCINKGTERPFTGDYWDNHEPGVYLCVVCGNELFSSGTKFDSGTGSVDEPRAGLLGVEGPPDGGRARCIHRTRKGPSWRRSPRGAPPVALSRCSGLLRCARGPRHARAARRTISERAGHGSVSR